MTTIIRYSVWGVALGVCAVGLVRAQESPAGKTGRVLILANQRGMEGDIRLEGNQYHIRRTAGEVSLPATPTMRLFADWDAALAHMSSQANLRDPDERLRLARWCQMNGLTGQALVEAKAAVHMRPGHAESKQLLAILERAARNTPAAPAPATTVEPAAAPPVDLSADAMNLFNTRIQPILMNACASCHATGRGNEFRLQRCHDATLNRRATQLNLAAVLAQIRWDEVASSPLLFKSLSAHGATTQAPFSSRQAKPYQYLQEWVQTVVATNPHLRKEPARVGRVVTAAVKNDTLPVTTTRVDHDARPTLDAKLPAPMTLPLKPLPVTATPLIRNPLPAPVVSTTRPAEAAPQPAATVAQPVEWCDPRIFNRQMHPGR
jgi:hypothetical protein